MAKTIEQLAEENASFIPERVYGLSSLWLRTDVKNACAKTANAVLEEIESLVDEEFVKHNMKAAMIIAEKIKELKGE